MLLELDGTGPRYAQITRALLSHIHSGLLPPGARVPGTRELARELACSRNVVLLAYEQLVLEGYLVGRTKAGTFVSADLPRPSGGHARTHGGPPRSLSLTAHGRALTDLSAEARPIITDARGLAINFMYGTCAPDDHLVSRLRASLASAIRAQAFDYIDPAGDTGLREQVSDRLRGARGIVRSPQQIIITNGTQQALDICARLLVGKGDGVVVEEPGYSAARALFAAAGGTLIPVPVDRHGLDPAALPGERRAVRVVYVTPSHQFPTGAVMSASRRHSLLAWAKQRGACIIEDDYDGELRYIGGPIKALAALDGADHVIYSSTVSKSLFPSLRLGYLALPEWLTADAIAAKWLADLGGSALIQQTVCDLMATGEYDRHISRMRRRYSAHRETLTRELRLHLRSEIEIEGDGAGLHLVVWMPNLTHAQVEALVAACERRGIGVYSIARHALAPLRQPGVMLGYGLLDESQIREGIRGLVAAYREVRRAGPSRSRGSGARRRAGRLSS
jgi:GntR family transcriptional regulator / MocR family aminotransferase